MHQIYSVGRGRPLPAPQLMLGSLTLAQLLLTRDNQYALASELRQISYLGSQIVPGIHCPCIHVFICAKRLFKQRQTTRTWTYWEICLVLAGATRQGYLATGGHMGMHNSKQKSISIVGQENYIAYFPVCITS